MKKTDAAHFLRGLMMGTANIIPGASGGTVALILGIYRRLIAAISHFDRPWLGLVFGGRWHTAAQHVDLRFLISLGFGVVAGTLIFGRLIHGLLTGYDAGEYQGGTFAVFFGFIAASTLLVARRVSRWNSAGCLLAILSGVVAYAIAASSPGASDKPASFLYLLCCGAVAISAMILPGISGALLLKLMGVYTQVTGYLSEFSKAQFTVNNLLGIFVFVVGCGVGLLLFTKLLRILLSRHYDLTLSALCGFMAGSLRSLWPWDTQQPLVTPLWQQIALFVALAIAGATSILLLEKSAIVEKDPEESTDLAAG